MLAALFFTLGIVLYRTRGHYRYEEVLALSFLFIVGATPFSSRLRRGSEAGSPNAWLVVGLFFFCLLLWLDPRLLYAVPGDLWRVKACLVAALLASAGAALHFFLLPLGRLQWWVLACLVFLCAAKGVVLSVSPSPQIDVFTASTEAVRHLLAGKHVYSQHYTDIYARKYGYDPAFVYLPGVLYFITPFYRLFGDVRAAFVAADIATLFVIVRTCHALRLETQTGWLFAALWAAFPVTLFITEQSWNEPLLILLVGLLFLSLIRGRWIWAGIWLGCLLASKQYLVLLALLTVPWIVAYRGYRAALVTAATSLGVLVALLLPFLISDMRGFFHTTVTFLGNVPPRMDAFTLTALLKRAGYAISPAARLLTYGVGFCFAVIALFRGPSPLGWSTANLFLYLLIFLAGTQAFCNYYFFAAFLALLSLIAQQTELARRRPLSPDNV